MIPESYGYDDNPCNNNNNTAKTPNTDNTTETADEGQLVENDVGENKDTIKLSNKQAAELSSQLSSKAPSNNKQTATELSSNQLLSSKLSEEEKQHQAHFFAQRFTTEWRICLKKASVDFDRAMQLFWSEVRLLCCLGIVCVDMGIVIHLVTYLMHKCSYLMQPSSFIPSIV